ncbi:MULTISPECIES: type II toxin-antitoxin system PemK/MazF family toxin [Pseudomonas]|uniref:type II toxin-antitoxin system PemK/MazF family toxin n=1 Tax=Pseudomonas sp. FW305-25 TaxID=2070636 RepID=UPI001179F668|nr:MULTISPECIES: type II toxin-antitoxin system PemK/MazF family toxin [Pseudomonas]
MQTANTPSHSLPSQGAANRYHPLPAPGDIVYCWFPEMPGVPGPKPRPAIVVAVAPSTHVVKVCFGTSKKIDKLYPGEFVISKGDAGFPLSGLSYTTKFDMTRSEKLTFDDDWFKVAPGLTPETPAPKIGTLHPSYISIASEAASVPPCTT